MSTFQHHPKLRSKCSTVLVPSLNLSLCAGEKSFLPVECCSCHSNPGFNFPCISCIISCHAAKIVENFHILQLFLVYHNLYYGQSPLDSHHLSCLHIHLHSTACLPRGQHTASRLCKYYTRIYEM